MIASDFQPQPIGTVGGLTISTWQSPTGDYVIYLPLTPGTRDFLEAEQINYRVEDGHLAVPYTRDVDQFLQRLVDLIGQLLYGQHHMRQLILFDDGRE